MNAKIESKDVRNGAKYFFTECHQNCIFYFFIPVKIAFVLTNFVLWAFTKTMTENNIVFRVINKREF